MHETVNCNKIIFDGCMVTGSKVAYLPWRIEASENHISAR